MKRFMFALLGGTHQHRWDAATGTCEKCHKEHPHHYEDGVCDGCGYGCKHPSLAPDEALPSQKHHCDVCGITADHEKTLMAVRGDCWQCLPCGFDQPVHTFNSSGKCLTCAYQCGHAGTIVDLDIDRHQCTFCQAKMSHTKTLVSTRSDCFRCADCGREQKTHRFNSAGECLICDYRCDHAGTIVSTGSYNHRCTFCNASEAHEFNVVVGTRESCRTCGACGQVAAHTFESGLCTSCNYRCDHAGTIEKATPDKHRCTFCDAMLPHNFEIVGARNACRTCSACGYTASHYFNATGKCSYCQYQCDHQEWRFKDDEVHRCTLCPVTEPHEFVGGGTRTSCRSCSTCGHVWEHSYDDTGLCGHCGFRCNHSYGDQFGLCNECGVQFCNHETTTTKPDGSVVCSVCKTVLKRAGDTFYIADPGSVYRGSYHLEGTLNGQKYYRQYKGTDSGSGSGKTTSFEAQNRYLFALNIVTPTNFGGDYKYTCQGLAFNNKADSLPINTELLIGNGRYIKDIKQYEMSGDHIATSSYTSPDWPALCGVTADNLITM